MQAVAPTTGYVEPRPETAATVRHYWWRILAGGVGALLTILTALHLGQGVLAFGRLAEIEYEEAVIYDQVGRVLRGSPLYQPIDRPPFDVAAYTPLYFYAAAALRALFGDGFAPGRGLSFAAGLLSAAFVAFLGARRPGNRWAGAFAAVAYLGLGFPGLYPWFATYRTDLLGVALGVGSVAALVGRPGTWRVLLAGLLVAAAVLAKQTLLSPGLAGAVWLWQWNQRLAVLFSVTAGVAVLGVSGLFQLATGAYVENTLLANANPWNWAELWFNLQVMALYQTGPMLAAGLFFATARRSPRDGDDALLILFWVSSALLLATLAKIGSSYNHWIMLAAATSLLATRAIWSRATGQTAWRALLPALLLGIQAVVLLPFAAAFGSIALGLHQRASAENASLQRTLERVRAAPGAVLADPMDAVALADREILFETVIFTIFYRQGLWDPAPVVRAVCDGTVSLLVLDRPVESSSLDWPPPILDVVRGRMSLDQRIGERYLYVPRPSGTCP